MGNFVSLYNNLKSISETLIKLQGVDSSKPIHNLLESSLEELKDSYENFTGNLMDIISSIESFESKIPLLNNLIISLYKEKLFLERKPDLNTKHIDNFLSKRSLIITNLKIILNKNSSIDEKTVTFIRFIFMSIGQNNNLLKNFIKLFKDSLSVFKEVYDKNALKTVNPPEKLTKFYQELLSGSLIDTLNRGVSKIKAKIKSLDTPITTLANYTALIKVDPEKNPKISSMIGVNNTKFQEQEKNLDSILLNVNVLKTNIDKYESRTLPEENIKFVAAVQKFLSIF